MKLDKETHPDFYGNYPRILEEKTDIFIGRRKWLREQWRSLYRLVNMEEVENLAFLAHRKSGKTSFLRKFYNLAFHHQREVIPFYYEFSNNKRNGNIICREIQQSLICQATDFLLGKSFYNKEGKFTECLEKLNELQNKHEWAKNILQRYDAYMEKEKVIPSTCCNELLEYVWRFVHRIDDKPCVLIVDEAQEMARSLFGIDHTEKKVIVPSHKSVGSIYNQQSVWILFSGSRVSELYYNMVGALANRISRKDFPLLKEDETSELVRELIKKYDYKDVYAGIYKDIWDITKGQPFYIQKILDPNLFSYDEIKGKPKSFKSHQDLKEILYFEVTHEQGVLRRFWENHFIENIDYLDKKKGGENVSEEDKGLTLRILYYIASNKKDRIYHEHIEEQFGISDVEEKVQQLINADLVQIEHQSGVVDKLNDNLLSLFLAERYSDKVLGTKNRAKIQEELDELMKRFVNKKFAEIEKTVKSNSDKIKSMDGLIQFHLGMRKQNEITKKIEEAIDKEKGVFANIKLLEKLKSVKVYEEEDGDSCEIDACAPVEINGEKTALIVEIKNWKKAIGAPQVKTYVEAMELVKQEMGCEKAMGVYISESGFSKPAEKILLKNNITFGTIDELIRKQDMGSSNVDSNREKKGTRSVKAKAKATKKKTLAKAKVTKKAKSKVSKKKKTA